VALGLVDKPNEVQLQEATFAPLLLARVCAPAPAALEQSGSKQEQLLCKGRLARSQGDSKASQQGTALRGAVPQRPRKKSRAGLVTVTRDGPGW